MVPMQKLIAEVSKISHVPVERIDGRGRHRDVVRLRQAIVYVVRRKTRKSVLGPMSYPALARWLGGLDHSTVMHGDKELLNRMRHKESTALAAYRIVVRAYVKLDRRDAEERAACKALVAKLFPMPEPEVEEPQLEAA